MAQIRKGSVNVLNGSSYVVANLPTPSMDWSQVAAGDLFTVTGSDVWYVIAAVDTIAIGSATFYRLTIVGGYAGPNATGVAFSILSDFSPNLNLPLMYSGDTNTPAMFTRAM